MHPSTEAARQTIRSIEESESAPMGITALDVELVVRETSRLPERILRSAT